ncbi:MAG: ABC transporter permease [Thaumarchaeota archaeon]|nr:ABC transporter permease [Nitrososphaerota archaeon]
MASRLFRYVILRLLLTIPMILFLLVFVFFIMRILPGDPAIAIAGTSASDAQLQAIRLKYGFDLPLTTQFLNFLSQALTGNFGNIIEGDKTVQQTIFAYMPNTIELAVAGIFLGAVLGILLGIVSAQTWSKKLAAVGYLVTQMGLSIPVFWIGLILQMVFGVYLRVLPVTDLIGNNVPAHVTGVYVLDSIITGNLAALEDSLSHLVLPALSIAIIYLAPTAAMTRANFRKVATEDFIVTQKAAGLSRLKIDFKYTMKNALLPVITLIGLQFAGLVSGAVLVESIYNINGIGTLLLTAITQRDFNLIQGTVIYIGIIVSLTSLVVDIIYSVVDPRVRH